MKIKVLNIYNTESWSDQDKLAGWFMGKFMQKYDWQTEFMIHAKDAKVIFRGSTNGALGLGAFKKFEEYFTFAKYSDYTYGFRLHRQWHQHAKRYEGIGMSQEVEITNPRVIAIYVYLLGSLQPDAEWTSNGLKIEDNEDQRPAAIAAFDLSQLLESGIKLDI